MDLKLFVFDDFKHISGLLFREESICEVLRSPWKAHCFHIDDFHFWWTRDIFNFTWNRSCSPRFHIPYFHQFPWSDRWECQADPPHRYRLTTKKNTFYTDFGNFPRSKISMRSYGLYAFAKKVSFLVNSLKVHRRVLIQFRGWSNEFRRGRS